jgi:hypothetical protein
VSWWICGKIGSGIWAKAGATGEAGASGQQHVGHPAIGGYIDPSRV